jgi:hypothetical protein
MMYDRKLPESARIARNDHAHPMPGRSTLVQQAYGEPDAAFPSTAAAAAHPATSSPLFDGDAQWEEIGPDEGERMVESIEPAPGDAADEAADETAHEGPGEAASEAAEDSAAEPGAHETAAGEAEAAPSTAADPAAAAIEDHAPDSAARRSAGEATTSGAPAPIAETARAAGRTRRRKPSVPSSAYATSHRKNLQNYRFRAGTRVTNTGSTAGGVEDVERGDFGAPNEYSPGKVPKKYRGTLLKTVSVDIGTLVGGSKRTRYRSGWVLVFHRGVIRNGRRSATPYSGDHTGWIQVKQLPDRARAKIVASETALRPKLRRGKGSGHAADATGDRRGFAFSNPDMLFNKKKSPTYYDFRIQGGKETTSLGNYTHHPSLYGDIVVGTWNPPGSGAGGKRFDGSGGIRAFLPLTAQFKLTTVPALTVPDASNRATSVWRYIQATVKGETIYCWLLQSWTTPAGSGHNF